MELEEIAREKRHQKAEKERLLSHNNGILRQSVDRWKFILKSMILFMYLPGSNLILRDEYCKTFIGWGIWRIQIISSYMLCGSLVLKRFWTLTAGCKNTAMSLIRRCMAQCCLRYIWHLDGCVFIQEVRVWALYPPPVPPSQFQVKVSNRVHADYLEGHIAYYIWKVFSHRILELLRACLSNLHILGVISWYIFKVLSCKWRIGYQKLCFVPKSTLLAMYERCDMYWVVHLFNTQFFCHHNYWVVSNPSGDEKDWHTTLMRLSNDHKHRVTGDVDFYTAFKRVKIGEISGFVARWPNYLRWPLKYSGFSPLFATQTLQLLWLVSTVF